MKRSERSERYGWVKGLKICGGEGERSEMSERSERSGRSERSEKSERSENLKSTKCAEKYCASSQKCDFSKILPKKV